MAKRVGDGEIIVVGVDGERDGAIVVAAGAREDAVRAVRHYVINQLSRRSQQNALDALKRIARLVLRNPEAAAEDFPWPSINYESAMAIRRLLFDQTVREAITPGTANLTLAHLRGIVRTMFQMGLVKQEQLAVTHPGMLKNLRAERKTRGAVISEDAERKLRSAARAMSGDYRGTMLDSAIVLAIGTGLRREEVANASVDNISEGDLLTVIGKGSKQREAVLDEQVQDVMQEWFGMRNAFAPDHRAIYCSPTQPNSPLTSWSFWSLVRHAAHDAFGGSGACTDGCSCYDVVTGPHDFRRTFATRLLERDWDIREVQVLMGHASPETTALYDKRSHQALLDKRRGTKVIA